MERVYVTFGIALQVPVDDLLRHQDVDTVIRETNKKEMEYQKCHVANTASHSFVCCNRIDLIRSVSDWKLWQRTLADRWNGRLFCPTSRLLE
jgi:hypothetical protein